MKIFFLFPISNPALLEYLRTLVCLYGEIGELGFILYVNKQDGKCLLRQLNEEKYTNSHCLL